MKNILLLLLPVLLLAASCKKEKTTTTPTTTPTPSNWKLNGESYTAYSVSRDDSFKAIIASAKVDSIFSTVYIVFNSLPSATGDVSYTIVNHTKPAPGEICILVVTSAKGSYTSNATGQVAVKVTGSKIEATIPSVWVKNIYNPADSIVFSGYIREE